MSENITNVNRPNDTMHSMEQLRSFPGMDKYSDEELRKVAAFLKEFSLILYEAASKKIVDQK